MASTAFFLGRPGSGKTTAFHIVCDFMQQQSWKVTRIREYSILQQMFHNDLEHKRFRPIAHGGFDVTDFSVLDEALQKLEQQVKDYQRFAAERELIVVEFARDNYQTALQPLSSEFLKQTHILYLEAQLDTCIQRIQQRVSANKRDDNHFVSEKILRHYYGHNNQQFMRAEAQNNEILRKVEPCEKHPVIHFIDNNGIISEFYAQIENFVQNIILQESKVLQENKKNTMREAGELYKSRIATSETIHV